MKEVLRMSTSKNIKPEEFDFNNGKLYFKHIPNISTKYSPFITSTFNENYGRVSQYTLRTLIPIINKFSKYYLYRETDESSIFLN